MREITCLFGNHKQFGHNGSTGCIWRGQWHEMRLEMQTNCSSCPAKDFSLPSSDARELLEASKQKRDTPGFMF